jgi:hypothetical protein
MNADVVSSCLPVFEGGTVLERRPISEVEKRILFVDGVQKLMFRKVQENRTWVYLVGLAAGAVEVTPKPGFVVNTLERELALFVPSDLLDLPFEDDYHGIPFKAVPYDPNSTSRTLNDAVSATRAELESRALNRAAVELGGDGLLFRDGPLKYSDPVTKSNGPVGLVKNMEFFVNVNLFKNYVHQLSLGQVSPLLELENTDDPDRKVFHAYLRLMDVGDPSSMEGVVRLDFVCGKPIEELLPLARVASQSVFSLSRVGPYPRSPYNLLAVEWLEKHLRGLLPEPSLLAIELAREVLGIE